MANVAADVRKHKETHPELYCAHPRCLWRIVTNRGPNPCRNHPLPRPVPPAPKIDVDEFVRSALDGVNDIVTLPITFTLAEFDEPKLGGLTAAQRPVYRQLEAALVARVGRLSEPDRCRLGIAFVLEWNRRGHAAAPRFHATDGRYFASDADRRTYQRWLDERTARDAARRARVESQQVNAQEVA